MKHAKLSTMAAGDASQTTLTSTNPASFVLCCFTQIEHMQFLFLFHLMCRKTQHEAKHA